MAPARSQAETGVCLGVSLVVSISCALKLEPLVLLLRAMYSVHTHGWIVRILSSADTVTTANVWSYMNCELIDLSSVAVARKNLPYLY